MEKNRILELALKELERQKAVISSDIEAIRSQLKETASQSAQKGPKSAAVGKAQSQRMKKYWAAKSKAAKKAPPAKPKGRAKTEAEKKALSLKMKEVWRNKKAEAAKKKK